ncbi:MAG: hypothetical protein RIK87_28060 [Fuerstiella sp.]
MDTEKTDDRPGSGARPRRWRRAAVASSVIGGMLFSGLAVLPLAVMNSSHRDALLNAQFQPYGLTVTSESGAGTWVTPVVLTNITLTDESGQIQCIIREIRTSRTMTGLLLHGGDLGTITFVEPVLQVALDEQGRLPAGLFQQSESPDDGRNTPLLPKQTPDLAVEVAGGTFVLSVPWRRLPIVDLGGLDVSAAITRQEEGRWLDVAPVQVFDHERISESHTEQNLALIAPVLSQSTSLTGDVSVRMNGLRLPLDGQPTVTATPISGTAVFHSVEARLKKDWVVQISRLLGRVTGATVPDRLQIVQDSPVAFEVDERGIYHHGLAFLLPQIAPDMTLESSGMVGLDEKLDLALSLQLPRLAAQNPFMAALAKMTWLPFQLQVKGTVDQPELVTPPGFSVVDQMSRNVDPEGHEIEPPALEKSVIDLIGAVSSPDPERSADGIVGGVLNIIRATQKAKETAEPASESPKKKKKTGKKRRKQQI